MEADDLPRYLEFYRDLGVREVYRLAEKGAGAAASPGTRGSRPGAEAAASPVSASPPPTELPPMIQTDGDTLLKILEDIGDCRRCPLHAGRTKLIFGVGDEKAPLVFVGEGPGADEDAHGI